LADGAWRDAASREDLWARLLAHRPLRLAAEIGVWACKFIDLAGGHADRRLLPQLTGWPASRGALSVMLGRG
jgi:hypothetical protein